VVQVSYRTFYTMETVGDRSSLRLEVNIAKAGKMYPLNTTPVPMPGVLDTPKDSEESCR